MDDALIQTLIFSGVFALIFGPLTARSAHRREPVRGGVIAQLFHLLGAIAFIAVLPGVLVSLIAGGGFRQAFPLGVALLLLSLALFVVFAVFERGAAPEDPSTS